jgi:hypothetical protein
MAKKSISREYRVYLAVWRKAFQERDKGLDPVAINASTYNLAVSMRQGMYRAIAPYRHGEAYDPELSQAVELFVAFLPKEPTASGLFQVILKPRHTLTELELQLADLGIGESDLLTESEKLAEKSLETLLGTGVSSHQQPNPFYKR